MAGTRSKAARGLAVLALAGAVAGTALAGSVTAAPKPATKKFVKKQIKKVQNQVNALSSAVIHNPVYYRRSDPIALPAVNGSFDTGFVACPTGTSPLGGGASVADQLNVETESSLPASGLDPVTGAPLAGTAGWAATVENNSASAKNFRVYVICAAVQKDSNYTDGSPPARMSGASREA
jgi:hypothetical protein